MLRVPGGSVGTGGNGSVRAVRPPSDVPQVPPLLYGLEPEEGRRLPQVPPPAGWLPAGRLLCALFATELGRAGLLKRVLDKPLSPYLRSCACN